MGFIDLLKAEGQYSELCTPAELLSTCAARDDRLGTIMAVCSNLSTISTVIHGLLLDRFGVRQTSFYGGVVFSLGLLLLAHADSKTFDHFLVGYALISWSGIAVLLP